MKISILCCLLYLSVANGQKIGINGDGKWFFGAEVGLNQITSMGPEFENSIQGGILVEYFFTRNWSFTGRIKYFETGVFNKYGSQNGVFLGSVIAVPLNLKRYFKIYKPLYFDVGLGVSINRELKSNYFYPTDENTDFSRTYLNLNIGLGLNYLVNSKWIVYVNYEGYNLGNDRDDSDWMEFLPNGPNNAHLNFGIKYNLFKINKNLKK